MSILELQDVHHAHDGQATLCGVSLAVEENEIVCLLGPSGCGKTTLLRLAAGLERLQRGTIRIGGEAVATPDHHRPPEERGIGFVFQDYALFPHLDVAANIAFGIRSLASEERRHRIEELLRLVGLESFGSRFPHSLSGGEQQRIALARALAPRPRLLLLDEPFSGLDASARHQMRAETQRILSEQRTAALLVTHDGEEAMELADRIALMRAGQLVQTGPCEELFFQPRDIYVASFLGSVNRLTGVVAAGAVPTPFGPISAPELRDGAEALIVIRQEGLELHAARDGERTHGQVASTRLLGGQRLTTVQLDGADETTPRVHVRHDATHVIHPGTRVALRLRPELAHVFPSTKETHAPVSVTAR